MKRTSKELKRLSRQTLIGKYGLVILAFFLCQIIISLAMSPFESQFNNYINGAATSQSFGQFPIGSSIASFIIGLISTVLYAGIMKLHLNLARGEQATVSLLFSQFTCRPDRFIVYTLLVALIGSACVLPGSITAGVGAALLVINKADYGLPVLIIGLVLFVAGIILGMFFSLRLSLGTMMLVDDPSLGACAAIKKSFCTMKGHCGRLLYIVFSFIPMILLVLLSFGIASFWIEPYMMNVTTWFYLDVIGEIDHKIEEEQRMNEEMGPVLSDESFVD